VEAVLPAQVPPHFRGVQNLYDHFVGTKIVLLEKGHQIENSTGEQAVKTGAKIRKVTGMLFVPFPSEFNEGFEALDGLRRVAKAPHDWIRRTANPPY
jgi:hypothetical protein